VWKENDDESKESIDTEEIIFVEETEPLEENWFNVRKSINEEHKELGSDMSIQASMEDTLEYETILDSDHDMGSTSSSKCIETFEDYFNLRCGKINPVQDILHHLSEQNVRTHHWKDYFQTSYLSRNEDYYNTSAGVLSNVKSPNITSVFDGVGDLVGDVEYGKEQYTQVDTERSINQYTNNLLLSDSSTKRNDGHGKPITCDRISVPLGNVKTQYMRENGAKTGDEQIPEQQKSSQNPIDSPPSPSSRSERTLEHTQQYRKQQTFRLLNKNHKRSLILKKLLEEEARDFQMYDDESKSTEVSALMIPLEEVSDFEAMGEERHDDVREKGRALSTTLPQYNTYRSNQFEYCVKNHLKWGLSIESLKKEESGKRNLIRGHENMKISEVQPCENGTSTKNEMTSDIEKNCFCETGFIAGIECK